MDKTADVEKLSHTLIKEELPYQDQFYKLVIVGAAGVGKSCLLLRGTKNEFKNDYEVTLGVEFGSYMIKIEEQIIKIQIWDTAGQETFQSMTKIFYKGAHCVFVVYNLTQEETFTKLPSFVKDIRENVGSTALLLLVGNMLDLEGSRTVSQAQAQQFAASEHFDYFIETSAKSGANVEALFVKASKLLYAATLSAKLPVEPLEPVAPEQEGVRTQKSVRIVDTSIGSRHKKGCSC